MFSRGQLLNAQCSLLSVTTPFYIYPLSAPLSAYYSVFIIPLSALPQSSRAPVESHNSEVALQHTPECACILRFETDSLSPLLVSCQCQSMVPVELLVALLTRGRLARLSLTAVQLVLPLVLVLLPSLRAVSSAAIWCGLPLSLTAIPPSPTTRLPAVALAHLNSSGYDRYSCTFTFHDFENAHSDWITCYHAPTVNVHTCPRDCLRSVDGDTAPHSATVVGSRPFHGSSAICLAAIHAGVVNASEGGAVHVDRFYPADWSRSDSQTLYPEGAAEGSESNGVRSLDVPLRERATPAAESSYSWSVRPRGVVPRQVQRAPFSPRSGHVHAWLYPQLQIRASWSTPPRCWRNLECAEFSLNYTLHFIIGGKNDTHYLNDVRALSPTLQSRSTAPSHPHSPGSLFVSLL